MLHQGPLDAKGCQDVDDKGKSNQLGGSQTAGEEATPEEVGEAEECVKEGVGVFQIQGSQQLHAEHMEGSLRKQHFLLVTRSASALRGRPILQHSTTRPMRYQILQTGKGESRDLHHMFQVMDEHVYCSVGQDYAVAAHSGNAVTPSASAQHTDMQE